MCLKDFKWLCLLALLIMGARISWGQVESDELRELLLNTTENQSRSRELDTIRRAPLLLTFYTRNHFSLAWQDDAAVNQLLFGIRGAFSDGLEPTDYYLDTLTHFIRRELNEEEQAVFDIYLTAAFLKFSKDLHEGKTDPAILHPGSWDSCIESLNYDRLLEDALNGVGVYLTLEYVKPQDNGYKQLKRALSEMREIASRSGLAEVQAGQTICFGDADERIQAIRTRLAQLNILPAQHDDQTMVYDSALFRAMTLFQEQNGLHADGVIGGQTQLALSLTANQYIEEILVNLERFRWQQSHLAKRSIRINIPAFLLELADDHGVYMQTKAIVGRADRRTPVLSSTVTMIILNPTWTIPPTVLREDVLPAVKHDVGYLRDHNIRVLNARGIELSPDSLPWHSYSADSFPFILREDPGPRNPLGLIKFYFPNGHSVYVHDTNVHSLFKETDRALSSGCVRIDSPMALVRMLLDSAKTTDDNVRIDIESGETKYVLLEEPMPIHLVYFTITANERGQLRMSKDIYGYDPIVWQALKKK